MSIAAVVVALIAVFLAFKFLTGMIKLVVLIAVIAAAAWFLLGGGA